MTDDRPTTVTCPVCGRSYQVRYRLDSTPVIIWVLDTLSLPVRTCSTRGCGVQLLTAVTMAERPKGGMK